MLCRAGSGDSCDPEENCSGSSGECPVDVLSPAGTECHAGSGDVCDAAKQCTGVSGEACPAPTVQPSGTVCRAGSGDVCDPEETCTGQAGEACPDDVVQPAGVTCYAGSGDLCDPTQQCSGLAGEACPAPNVALPTTVCRTGSGDVCDPDELCTGLPGESCPADAVEPSTRACRSGSGDLCDPSEFCPGVAGQACPSDVVAPSTTLCRAGSGDPTGSGIVCDPGETCTGDPGETCPDDVLEPNTLVCRPGSGDVCDPSELCPGTPGGSCPPDVVAPAATVCRTGGGDPHGSGTVCDPDELCSGNPGETCPVDERLPAETACRSGGGDPNGSGFTCDPEEFCPGTSGAPCPPDDFADADTVCRPGSGGFVGGVFTCDAGERCPGAALGVCPADVSHPVTGGQIVRAMRDTRTMETHRSSNNGATGLFWLKRSPNVRGIIGFDLSCQNTAMDSLDCGILDLSIHEGLPTLTGASFSAHVLNVPWEEGNQAFDSFSWKGNHLGSFPGTGRGTTWGCRVDLDLDDSGAHNCSDDDRWWGGDICGESTCYTPAPSANALFTDDSQTTLAFELSADLLGHAQEISYLLKVTDEEDSDSGSVKLYQRDGARFIAETDPETPPDVAFDLAPALVLFGSGLTAPEPVLIEPASRGAIGNSIDVTLDQVGEIGGDPPRWHNKTIDTWGYLSPSAVEDWEATIPLASGPNEVEFTMFDPCNTEGQASYVLTSAAAVFCGNGIVESGEQCDDGNDRDGDCCSQACTIEPDGSLCDDGDVCTAASSCANAVCVGSGRAPAACGDSYLCYKAAPTREAPPFFPQRGHGLADALGPNQVDVRTPKTLCLPGSVDGDDVLGPSAHRIGYKVKETTKRELARGVRVTDRFGSTLVDLQKTALLLAPAGYALDAPASPLDPGLVDTHQCYRVKSVEKFPRGSTSSVAETLENRVYERIKPAHLCLATASDGLPTLNPDAHLMCYRVRRASGQAKHTKVRGHIQLADEFGALALDTRREAELCVSASVELP